MKWFLTLVLFLFPLSSYASGSPQDDLNTARNAFQFSDYGTARRIMEDLIQSGALTDDKDKVDALRIAGLCSFYANDMAKAEDYFTRLLYVDPDFKMNPFYTPPGALSYFDVLKGRLEEKLHAVRQAHRDAEAARKRDEAERLRANQTIYRDVETHHKALAFLPLGVGQFQNGDTGLGVTLASLQVATGLTSLGCYLAVSVMNSQHPGGLPAGKLYDTAATLRTTSVVTGAVFFATWVFGAAQALSGFQPEVVTQSPSESASSHRITPFAAPVQGGGVAGVGLGF